MILKQKQKKFIFYGTFFGLRGRSTVREEKIAD